MIRYFSLQQNDNRFEFIEFKPVYDSELKHNVFVGDPVLVEEQKQEVFNTREEAQTWLYKNFYQLHPTYLLHWNEYLENHVLSDEITDTYDPTGNHFQYAPYVKKENK